MRNPASFVARLPNAEDRAELATMRALTELRVTLREWHRRIPDYRIKPGHEELEYPPGLRHVKDLILVWD